MFVLSSQPKTLAAFPSLRWVKSAGLTPRRPLPVYPIIGHNQTGPVVRLVPVPDIDEDKHALPVGFHADCGPVSLLRFVVEPLTTDHALPGPPVSRAAGKIWVMSRPAASGRPGSIGLAAH